MRNLTIKREKRFVGSLAKMKVYIEDYQSGEILINNIPCRKIGVIKNGEEKTFEIEERSAKIFVIADKLSKNFCNEYYQLPEGEEDIFLTGKNKFNLANGNAFIFDNNQTSEVLEHRKGVKRRGIVILVISAIVGAILGYFLSSDFVKPKDFTSGGMTVTLTNQFVKIEDENFEIAYSSEEVAVFVLKEKFSTYQGLEDYSLEQYAELMIEANSLVNAEIETKQGLTYFVYDYKDAQTNETWVYYSYVYKSNDSFWGVQFAVQDKDINKYEKQIFKWAKSVSFEK